MQSLRERPQFALATLLLVTTLAAIALGISRYFPCLGIFALVLGPPVVLRAAVVGYSRHKSGQALSVGDKIELLITSFYAVMVSVILGFVFAVVAWLMAAFTFALLWSGNAPDATALVEGLLSITAGASAFGFSMWGLTFPLDVKADR